MLDNLTDRKMIFLGSTADKIGPKEPCQIESLFLRDLSYL